MATVVETIQAPIISDADADRIAHLIKVVYANPNKKESDIASSVRAGWRGYRGDAKSAPRRSVVRSAAGEIIASGMHFPRTIRTNKGDMTVLALAEVLCLQIEQGKGFGRTVVRAAFDRVDQGEFPWCFFQTGDAKGFYEKLGCVLVTNPIVNSLNLSSPAENPFWDTWVMRYPAKSGWPEGQIDLLGPGY